MIQDKIFFDEKDPTGLSYNTPFTYYGSYQGRLWSKSPTGSIQYYTQNSDLSAYATTGSNQFSGSQTVTGSLTVTGTITGTVAGTTSTASYVEYTNVANKPALVSGSSQVTYSGLTGVPSGIVSGSAQVASFGIFATTGSNGFNGSQSITGSLTVTGQVVAQTLNVQQVTSSIVYSSGSNIFGNTLANTQQFTGSVSVTGSLTVTTNGTELQVTSTGVNLGNISTDNHNVTGSLIASGSLGVTGSLNVNGQGTFYQPLTNSTAYLTVQNNRARNAAVYTQTTNGGFYAGTSIGTDTFNYQIYDGVAGSARLTIASTGEATFSSTVRTGGVSIGVASTANVLDVRGENNTFDGTIVVGARGVLQHRDAGQTITSLANDYNNDAAKIEFRMKGNTTTDAKMTILGSGNVGIGTASPNANLDIQRVAGDSSDILRLGSNQNYYFGFSRNTSNGALQIQGNQTGNNNISLAPTSGNVGIGTATPTDLLTLYRNASQDNVLSLYQGTNGYAAAFKLIGNNDDGARYNNIGSYTNGGTVHWLIGGGAVANTMVFYTNNNAERMRINSAGYLKVSNTGTYAGATGGYHEIIQSTNNTDLLLTRHTGTSPYGTEIQFTGASPNNTTNWFEYFQDSTTSRFIVFSNGGIHNYQANNQNLSDERVKKDIIPLESYWDKFKAIEIVKFKYKDQTHDDFNIGVIAQQVEAVAPEFVDIDGWDTKPKLDEEGNEIVSTEEPLKSIYTADLYHATIKVLQEVMAKIETLEAKIQTLEQQ